MKSNYKRLGDYISFVDNRNRNLEIENLIGLSTRKIFIPSISNTIGTDMSTYRIINTNQFAFCPVTSRNSEKITIAIYQENKTAMISQAYDVFKVNDEEELMPEYLMMWCRRPEFDRYARFISHGSVREMFSWEDMCDVKLPIPPIEKQKEIVKEYNTLTQRIKLNETLIKKLEETAQAIYKHWFVDFEFPDADGQPYKSNGGEMIESELGEIPVGWRVGELKLIISFKNGKVKPNTKGSFPVYGGNGITDFVNKFNEEDAIIIGRVGAYCGSLFMVKKKCWVSDNAISAKANDNLNRFGFYVLDNLKINERSEGTGQPLITQNLLNEIKLVIPTKLKIEEFEKHMVIISNKKELKSQELSILETLKILLLSKLATQ